MSRLTSCVFTLVFLCLLVSNCDKYVEKDYFVDNRPDVDFIIRNDTKHSILIVVKDNYEKGKFYELTIDYQDSILRSTKGVPFWGNIYVVIDDTIKFQCDTVNWNYNLESPSSYDTIEVGDNYYKMHYVIDEDFYEYAKSHAYKE